MKHNVTLQDLVSSLGKHSTMLKAIKSDFRDKIPTLPPNEAINSGLVWDFLQGTESFILSFLSFTLKDFLFTLPARLGKFP